MEPRKVQRVGTSTLAVSLPSKWVKTTGLKRGDVVYFNQEDGTLKLFTSSDLDKDKSIDTVEIYADLCQSPTMLARLLVGNYMLGRDIIRVVSETRLKGGFLEAIRNTIKDLMGLAIMEETPNQVILQSSIDITQFPIHTLIRRLFILASTMYTEAIDSFFESDINMAKDTIHRKNESDTMFWIIIRLLDTAQREKIVAERIDIQDPVQILWYRVTAQCLWLMANWSEKIANRVIALEPNRESLGDLLLSETQTLSDSASSIADKSMKSLFSSDLELANQVIEEYNHLQQSEEQLQEKICSHAYLREQSFSVNKYFKKEVIESCMVSQLSFILWSIRRIAELSAEIAELAITKALSKETKFCKESSAYI